jgi:hypothetical protein
MPKGCEVGPRLLARFDRVTDGTHKVESTSPPSLKPPAAGEVLISSTVKDLVAGAGISVAERATIR